MKYIIKINDTHVTDSEKESSELITTGSAEFYSDEYKIRYKETSEGLENCYVTLTVKGQSCVTMHRTGNYTAEMVMEKGKRHTCVYATPAGNFSLGIYTSEIKSDITENGGTLKFVYTLDINSSFLSENTLVVSITRKEN